MKLETIGM
jgi:hypothetical protein